MMFNSVNQYCLNSIVALSEVCPVSADEDILDEHGNKLWARGLRISRDLQERLLRRKLARPIETTLTAEGAITFVDVIRDCRHLIAEQTLLAKVAGGHSAQALIDDLRTVPIPGPLRLLLTAVRDQYPEGYRHMLSCVAVSAGIAARTDLPDHEAKLLLIAALLHDLGEMYINPDYVRNSDQLNCAEWKHVASHPRVGQMLIQEMTSLPPSVGICILQHHQRLDGSGYPHYDTHMPQHPLGALLATADAASAIIMRSGPGAVSRVELALKIVPEEFDRQFVSALLHAFGDDEETVACDELDCQCAERAAAISARLGKAMDIGEAHWTKNRGRCGGELVGSVLGVLHNIEKSVRATGILELEPLGDLEQNQELLNEIRLVIMELEWRMRNLARNLYIRAEAKGDRELHELWPLIRVLDDTVPWDPTSPDADWSSAH